MFEADTLCQTVAMINKGKLIAIGSPTEIKQRLSNIVIIEVTVKEATRGLADDITSLEGVQRVDIVVNGVLQKSIIHSRVEIDIGDKITAIVGQSGIDSMVSRDPTLEEAYLNMLK